MSEPQSQKKMRYHQFENKQAKALLFYGKIRNALMLVSVSISFFNHLMHSSLTRNKRIRDWILESN